MSEFLTISKRILRTELPRLLLSRNITKKVITKKNKMSKIQTIPIFVETTENIFRPFRVSVEGNIGAGKSTVINYFAQQQGVETYAEPINWWQNLNGHNLLNLLYTDINKWYTVFQKYVQLTRIQVQTSEPKFSTTNTQIFERSLQNNRFCFVEQAKVAGYLKPPDFEVLDQWYQWINENLDIDIDLIVYLRTSPEVVFERIKNRARKEELTISYEYLEELHASHEKWLLSNDTNTEYPKLIVIDADKTVELVLQQCEENMEKIVKKMQVRRTRRNSILKQL